MMLFCRMLQVQRRAMMLWVKLQTVSSLQMPVRYLLFFFSHEVNFLYSGTFLTLHVYLYRDLIPCWEREMMMSLCLSRSQWIR